MFHGINWLLLGPFPAAWITLPVWLSEFGEDFLHSCETWAIGHGQRQDTRLDEIMVSSAKTRGFQMFLFEVVIFKVITNLCISYLCTNFRKYNFSAFLHIYENKKIHEEEGPSPISNSVRIIQGRSVYMLCFPGRHYWMHCNSFQFVSYYRNMKF